MSSYFIDLDDIADPASWARGPPKGWRRHSIPDGIRNLAILGR
jgi:hypothetical protein